MLTSDEQASQPNELFGSAAGEAGGRCFGLSGEASSSSRMGLSRSSGRQDLLSADDLFASPVATSGTTAASGATAAGSATRTRAEAATGSGGRGPCFIEGDEQSSDCESSEADELVSKPGSRLWNATVVHSHGVGNWRDVPNCKAAHEYECPCGKRCL